MNKQALMTEYEMPQVTEPTTYRTIQGCVVTTFFEGDVEVIELSVPVWGISQ